MKYFFDTEFLEGTQNKFFGKTKPTIDLISLGMVDETGREFYEISKDFNLKEAWNRWQQRTGEGDRNNREPRQYWIRENVLYPIYKDLKEKYSKELNTLHSIVGSGDMKNVWHFSYGNLKWLINRYGKTNIELANEICRFIFGSDSEEDFDMTALQMANKYEISDKKLIPEFYAYYADYDWVVFCWIFGNMMSLPKGFPMYCKDLKQIMDEKQTEKAPSLSHIPLNVTEIKNSKDYPKQENEHHALADARWNKKLFEFLTK